MDISEVSQKNTKTKLKAQTNWKHLIHFVNLVNCETIHFSPPKEELIDSAKAEGDNHIKDT